jgi:hypothetical protein
MDPMSLAAAAAAAVGGYLARTASGAAEHAADKAGGKLVQLVSDRLQASREGRTALLELQDRPADTARRDAVAGVLSGELTRSPKFAESVAKLVAATQHPAITGGDGNVVNTGSWDNRRGTVATGGSRVDQSRHLTLRSGVVGWAVALAVVAGLGTTAAVTIDNSGPEYPELEGDWSGRTTGSRVALHVTDEQFTFQVVGFGGEQMRCTGAVTQDDDTHYGLGTDDGVCGRIAITTAIAGDKLEFEFDNGPDGVLRKD